VEEGAKWLLTQGGLGFAILGLIGVVWRLWTALEHSRKENSLLQKEHGTALLALHERTLAVLQATNSQLSDNTKAIELSLRKGPRGS
jgi:hypothetical protein